MNRSSSGTVTHLTRTLAPPMRRAGFSEDQLQFVKGDEARLSRWHAGSVDCFREITAEMTGTRPTIIIPPTAAIVAAKGVHVTRLQVLEAMHRGGIHVWNDNPHSANFASENDKPTPLGRIIEPDEIDERVYSLYGKGLPWGGDMRQQMGHFGGKIADTRTVLASLFRYVEIRGALPMAGTWTAVRCSDLYGADYSLRVDSIPDDGVDVNYGYVRDADPGLGAFPGE